MLLKDKDPRANSFDFPGGPEAVLLVHGFTGSCAEMLPIGKLLNREFGWRTVSPLLPGHGTTLEDLEKYTRQDWYQTVEKSYLSLKNKFSRIHLVGLSMGSLLCLELFRNYPKNFASLALLVPPVYLKTWYQRTASQVTRCSIIASLIPRAKKNPPPHPDQVAYDHYSPKATAQFTNVYLRAQSLPQISVPPTFICYSLSDEVVNPKSALFLEKQLKSPFMKVLKLEESSHVISVGEEKEKLFAEMTSFYKTISPSSVQLKPASQSL